MRPAIAWLTESRYGPIMKLITAGRALVLGVVGGFLVTRFILRELKELRNLKDGVVLTQAEKDAWEDIITPVKRTMDFNLEG